MTLTSVALQAQGPTKVSGVVKDAATGELLPYVGVYFEGTDIGVSTDDDGYYEITTEEVVSKVVGSYVGYLQRAYMIAPGKTQVVNLQLSANATQTAEAVVIAKREKYSKKDNPAVDLMRAVIDHKDGNGVGGQAYCVYDKYEKIQVDLNNINADFRQRKIFNGLEFLWDYLDSTDAQSKPYLPMLLRETNSKVYARAQPTTEREYISGSRASKLDAAIDQSNLNQVINTLYQNVDIYDDEILLLEKQFLSPLAPLAISFYRFYIVDTIELAGQRVTTVSFIPKNQATYGFTGSLYIATDSSYQVLGVEMGLYGEVNLNFVRTISVEQEFRRVDSIFLKAREKVVMDFALTDKGMGFTGTKSVYYANYDFDAPEDLAVFDGIDKVTVRADAEYHDDAYWANSRQVPLNKNEAGIYLLVDTMANSPKFKRIQKYGKVLLTGYVTVGKVDIGPWTSIATFNNIEGIKPQIGGQTNLTFSKKLFLQGYSAYGVQDERFKYAGFATYSFNENHLENPRHYVTASYVKDTRFPGFEQGAVSSNNTFASLRWGIQDKILFTNTFRAGYVKETKALELGLYYLNDEIRPYGNLRFDAGGTDGSRSIASVTASEVGFDIRFAPNQQYTQRGTTRNRIYNKYPIFSLSYGAGFDGVLGGDYGYHKIDVTAFKRFNLSILGSSYIEVGAGKIFGDVPYILMHIPKANQTYVYRNDEYSLLNFLEFVGDEYVNINAQHYFEGFFFNRIPLVKKAKLREVITFRATVGSVSDANDPSLNTGLIQFPVDDQNRPITSALSSKPYMEVGLGVLNIAKVLRVDLVQRLTYLDQPGVQQLLGNKGLALRASVAVGF